MSSPRSRRSREKRHISTSRPGRIGIARSSTNGRTADHSGSRIERGSGNVFLDLGFSPAEAMNLQLRSQLMTELIQRLEVLGLKQNDAARRLGVSQPRISDLVRGKIGRFSVDTLIAMLGRVGKTVTITVR